jgi:hypothetical protein
VATKPSASPLSCSRCGTAMKDVVTIAPLASNPGLIAYECPVRRSCSRITFRSREGWDRRTRLPRRAPMRGATVNREALEGWFR